MTISDPRDAWPLPPRQLDPIVVEWLQKAQMDGVSAVRDFEAPVCPNFDSVCFHAQQAVEKLVKGVLTHHAVVPPRTHDLIELSDLLSRARPDWSWASTELRQLSRAAVEYRYPGHGADCAEAERALAIARRLWSALSALL